MDQSTDNKIASTCPSGHKLRGNVSLSGEKVICPRCKQVFIFGVSESRTPTSVSDTGVMRILGDIPKTSQLGFAEAPATKPCGRCGVAIDATAPVCKHCNSYVGVMPEFMRSVLGTDSISQN
ncbi:MAG: hypothetical protein WBD20_16565 [Pirellulaceae bacterium]